MPGGAAGNDNNAPGLREHVGIFTDTAKRELSVLSIQAATQTVKDGLRLFKDLLYHKVVMTTFLNGCKLDIQFLDIGSLPFVGNIFQDQFVCLYDRDLVVVHIYHFFCVLYNGRCVRGQEVFALAYAYYQRTAFTGGYQRVWIIFIYDHDHVSAYHPFEGDTQGFFNRALVAVADLFYKMYQYFCIGIAFKLMSLVKQFLF